MPNNSKAYVDKTTLIEKYKSIFAKMRKLQDDMQKRIAELKRPDLSFSPDEKKLIDSHSRAYKFQTGCLEMLLHEWDNSFSAFYSPYNLEQHSKLNKEITHETRSVEADTDGEILIVHMPKLPLKKQNMNSHLYDKAMSVVLAELRESKGIPQIQKKLLRIVHIYDTKTNPYHIADNDNFDIKHVVDNVTDWTLGGDGGLSCKILLEAYMTDEVPAGCYVIVEPNDPYSVIGKTSLEIIKNFDFGYKK